MLDGIVQVECVNEKVCFCGSGCIFALRWSICCLAMDAVIIVNYFWWSIIKFVPAIESIAVCLPVICCCCCVLCILSGIGTESLFYICLMILGRVCCQVTFFYLLLVVRSS